MRTRFLIALGICGIMVWATTDVMGRGGGRGGGGGGRGGGGGGARVSGGGGGGGARVSGGNVSAPSRTPSFSPPANVSRPSGGGGGPSVGTRPSVGSGGPSVGTRPSLPANPPSTGARPGGGDRAPDRNLPSTRPDVGGRPGIGGPGASTLPVVGGAALGAGLANRAGDRPAASLPGLGDRTPNVSQINGQRTTQERRDSLNERLSGQREGQPARDWNQTREGWQQQRDNVRDDWQNNRDAARDDWQNWFDDHYYHHGGWYWGHAGGYWGRWDHLWDNYPVAAAVGLTWWGANTIGYQMGCSEYYNPYYTDAAVSYAEPIISAPVDLPTNGEAPTALPPGVSPEAVAKFEQARAAFYEGKNEEALKLTDEAVKKMPRDAVLHEFRSLVLFALKRYPEAAAAIHAVLAVGPGWDWKSLSGLYADVETYTAQLRALENHRDANPKAADVRFLTGYHYLTCGHNDKAIAEFKRTSELQPKDSVSAALVASLSPRDAEPSKLPAEAPAPKPVPPDKIVGAWTADGKDSAKFAMNLQKDGTFTWTFTQKSRKQEAKGVYTVEGNVLAMEPDTGGVMLAELTAKSADNLLFKMIGGAANDPGLDFHRGSSK